MIRFEQGNLLEANAEALVNTVNEVGVMGKGIALMFRDAYPLNTELYTRAAKARQIAVGKMFVTENPEFTGVRWIINFPTKKHWRQPSKIEWIREGLKDLVRVIRELRLKSIAIPPLGCGNGGLEWNAVRSEIMQTLSSLDDVNVLVYQPTNAYQGKPKATGVEKLTPARAIIAELVRRYGFLGLDCTILEVQKLAWFVSRAITRAHLSNPLRLAFKADKYGPYDDRLRHLLDALDGSYLHSAKRVADSSPFDSIWFDPSRRKSLSAYLESTDVAPYLPILDEIEGLIDGFESPYGMELLATVDWLISHEHVEPNVAAVQRGLAHWPSGGDAGQRKATLFDANSLRVALERVTREAPTRASSLPLFDQ